MWPFIVRSWSSLEFLYRYKILQGSPPSTLLPNHASNFPSLLQWRHNDHDGVSNHQPHGCLLNHLFRCRWKETSKLHYTGLCVWNSPVTGEFPAQMASNAENVFIWWRHQVAWVDVLPSINRDENHRQSRRNFQTRCLEIHFSVFIKISLDFIPKRPVMYQQVLIQAMAWCYGRVFWIYLRTSSFADVVSTGQLCIVVYHTQPVSYIVS